MQSAEGTGLPRQVMAFQVGVTGHRALPGCDRAALQAAAAGLFRRVREEVLGQHAADQAAAHPLYRPDPPALRCLCGLAEGADSILAEAALAEGWDVVAVLPFARDEFARNFTPGPALDRYRALLERSTVVSELEGVRERGGEPYAQIGQQIVEQSDLMLAVWDRLPPRGPGGTGDVVQQALDRGVPVAVLPPVGPAVATWHSAGDGEVAALVGAALHPPPNADGFPQAAYADASDGAPWARAVVRWFERAVLVGTAHAAIPAVQADPGAPVLAGPFAAADRLAGDYAARYRAAGLLRYALVLPATVASFVVTFGEGWLRPGGYLLQFGSLAAVVWFSTRGGWERAQARFIWYRGLAEYFRSARLLATLGAVAQAPGVAAHQARASDWTSWYARAAVRAAGLQPRRFDAGSIVGVTSQLRTWTEGEIAYLLDRAERDAIIARRLKGAGLCLVIAGIACAAAHAALVVGSVGEAAALWSNMLALVLPALAPLFLGLLSFGEYSRLATRYRAVAAELRLQVAALERVQPDRAGLLRVARRISEVMLAEAADWQMLVKARTLSAY